MRPFLNAVKTGFAEIKAHKMRSVLSFLAIAVGSVVFMDAFSAIFLTYERLEKQKEVSGMARLKISQNSSRSWSSPDGYVQPPSITYEDALAFRKKFPEFYMVSPSDNNWRTVLEYENRRLVASVAGVTPEWTKRDFVYTLRGRLLDWRDVEEGLRVCVLKKKAVPPPSDSATKSVRKKYDYTAGFDTLVSHQDMLGKIVKLDGITFTVIGVLEELPVSKRPITVLESMDQEKILAPVTTLVNFGIFRSHNSLDISVDTGDERNFDEALRSIENFLRVRFGDGDFFIIENQLERIRDKISSSVKASLMTISLGLLAFIAGGIGIMNVTLATVFARTREIGVRRAVGASRGDIMLQFMVEAAMLGLIGGLLGSGAGYLWGVPAKIMLGLSVNPIKPWMPLVSIFIAVLTAFLFSIYPAWVAAGLKPADALRAE